MPNPELITARDLDQWADSLAARSNLPRLVRRLILSNRSVTQVEMRAGEGIIVPGWDGVVDSQVADAHVPLGTSRWEMSAGDPPGDKAQENYRKRTDDPGDVDPLATTFVFVTPRAWRERDEWVARRKEEGKWADVRAYDADSLETWLERAPGVHVWISELLGREPLEVRTLDNWWDAWSTQTTTPLPAPFVLAGRDTAVSDLQAGLGQPPQLITVVAPSREEALATICAAFVSDDVDAEGLLSRALVISGAGAWARTVAKDAELALIPTFDDADVASALRRGHHVIVPMSTSTRMSGLSVVVAPLDRDAARTALESVGLKADFADKYARHARRNLISLRRTLAINPALKKPAWSNGTDGHRVMTLVLAGSWDEDTAGDKEMIERLTDTSYPNLEAELAGLAAQEDAPIRRTARTWRVVSKEDEWDLTGVLCTAGDLNRLEGAVVEVLREDDPSLDLQPDERHMAAVLAAPRRYSRELREDLADTIAFLGGYVDEHIIAGWRTGREQAILLVRAVLAGINDDPARRAWPSAARELPLLAEASPDAFLDAVEGGLAGDDPPLLSMFAESSPSTFGSTSPHVYLLWALEVLCWSPDYLSRAAATLARLAEIDPGGQGGNRPARSLNDVFSLYLTQTAAPLERRLAVIDGLRLRFPEATWALLRAILPNRFAMGNRTARPRWRTWCDDCSEDLDLVAVTLGAPEIVSRLLEDVSRSDKRWVDLLEHVDALPEAERGRVLNRFEAHDPASLGPDDRFKLWTAMRELTARHRQFQHAGWALPPDVLDRLDQLVAALHPSSIIDEHVHLFEEHPRLADVPVADHGAYESTLKSARLAAVEDVLTADGVDGLLALGARAKLPVAVGYFAAEVSRDELAEQLLPLLGGGDTDGWVAHGYARSRIEANGLQWAEQRLEAYGPDWPAARRVSLLLAAAPSLQLFEIVGRMPPDVADAFWLQINPWAADLEAKPELVRQLLAHHRTWLGVNVLAGLALSSRGGQPDTNPAPSLDLVEEALLQAATGPSIDTESAEMLVWEVEQLIDYLEREGSDVQARARIEFLLSPLLEYTRPARALSEALRTSPTLFAEIVGYVYRAEGEASSSELSPQRLALAQVGYTVLRSWQLPPGVRPEGGVDAEVLRTWVVEARRLLAAAGRRKIGDQTIGQMLALVPAETSGSWPAQPVRDLVEEFASSDLETGIENGRFNSRGVVTRSPSGGGDLERALAEQYKAWADSVVDRWPRTAAMLRRLAGTYEELARREDAQSQEFGDLA